MNTKPIVALLVLLGVGAAMLGAADAPDKYAAYRDACAKAKAALLADEHPAIARQKEMLKRAKVGRIDATARGVTHEPATGKMSFPNADSKKRYIASAESKLAELSEKFSTEAIKAKPLYLPMPDKSMEVGLLGTIRGQTITVQIVDDTNMIVDWWRSVPDALKGMRVEKRWLWIEGYPTAGIVDGKEITIDVPMECTGTKRYDTVDGGTKTLFVLSPIPADKLKD